MEMRFAKSGGAQVVSIRSVWNGDLGGKRQESLSVSHVLVEGDQIAAGGGALRAIFARFVNAGLDFWRR